MPIVKDIALSIDSVNVNIGDMEDLSRSANIYLYEISTNTKEIENLLDGAEGAESTNIVLVTTANIGADYVADSVGNIRTVEEVINPTGTPQTWLTTFYYRITGSSPSQITRIRTA